MIWMLNEMMESTGLVFCLVFHPVNFHFKIQDPESLRMCLSLVRVVKTSEFLPQPDFRTLMVRTVGWSFHQAIRGKICKKVMLMYSYTKGALTMTMIESDNKSMNSGNTNICLPVKQLGCCSLSLVVIRIISVPPHATPGYFWQGSEALA